MQSHSGAATAAHLSRRTYRSPQISAHSCMKHESRHPGLNQNWLIGLAGCYNGARKPILGTFWNVGLPPHVLWFWGQRGRTAA